MPANATAVISRPSFAQKLALQSLHAQRAFERTYQAVARDLLSISVVLRVIAKPQQADSVESMVAGIIEELETRMRADTARMELLREENGITDVPSYTAPVEVLVNITSPMASRYLGVVVQMDGLMAAIDSLWLCGVLSNAQRDTAAYDWQMRLQRAANRVRAIERRAMGAARRAGANVEEEEKEKPSVTESDTPALEPTPDDAQPAEGQATIEAS